MVTNAIRFHENKSCFRVIAWRFGKQTSPRDLLKVAAGAQSYTLPMGPAVFANAFAFRFRLKKAVDGFTRFPLRLAGGRTQCN